MSEANVREHRRPQVEKRKATHNIVSIPFFADTAKNTGKKKIPDGQTCLPKSGSAFCRDANDRWKIKKMVARAGIEPTTNCLEGSCSIH